MKPARRQFLHLAAGAVVLPAASRIAWAQTYPSRPIMAVVPFTAGGPTDALVRTLGERMRTSLGQPLVVENVTGAAGTIGVGRVARAAPDGYTVSIGHWSTHVINSALYPLPFDLLKDLEPVSLLTSYPMLLLTKNTVPAKDLRDLIAWLKANQEKVSVGTIGVGSAAHVAAVYFQNLMGLKFQFVPLSRRRACHAGPDRRANRCAVRSSGQCAAASARRQGQGLRRDGQHPLAGRA
jgi:tripartite-type tricarboxylate transporter receptor subunit TctC